MRTPLPRREINISSGCCLKPPSSSPLRFPHCEARQRCPDRIGAALQSASLSPRLLGGFHRESFNLCNVRQQLLREIRASLADSVNCRTKSTFVDCPPKATFQKKIDRAAWRRKHQRSTSFRTSKDQQFCRRHLHSDLLGFSAVINQSEQRDQLGLQDILELSTVSPTECSLGTA